MFGTFATRSGVIESVHSFARSEVGFPMLAFWAAMTLVALATLLWRWRRGELRDERQFANLLSRESLFVLNNVVFIALIPGDILGQLRLADHIRAASGQVEVTIGAETFEFYVVPLFIAMYGVDGCGAAYRLGARPRYGVWAGR